MIRKCIFGMVAIGISLSLVTSSVQALSNAQIHTQLVKTKSMFNLQKLYNAIWLYQTDNKVYPPMHTPQAVAKALLGYGYPKSKTTFLQPLSGQPYLPNPNLSGKSVCTTTLSSFTSRA